MTNKSGYNPNIHNRKSIRLKGYDYSQAGLYFITICCQDRICRFGKIQNDEMVLNEFGKIAFDEWMKLPERFLNFKLDVFQIMPNHMHGIIALTESVRERFTRSQNNDPQIQTTEQSHINPDEPKNKTIGDMIGAYKSLVANGCLEIHKQQFAGVNPAPTMGKIWQRNYYERIIRDERSYQNIAKYIVNNPAKWNGDKFFNTN